MATVYTDVTFQVPVVTSVIVRETGAGVGQAIMTVASPTRTTTIAQAPVTISRSPRLFVQTSGAWQPSGAVQPAPLTPTLEPSPKYTEDVTFQKPVVIGVTLERRGAAGSQFYRIPENIPTKIGGRARGVATPSARITTEFIATRYIGTREPFKIERITQRPVALGETAMIIPVPLRAPTTQETALGTSVIYGGLKFDPTKGMMPRDIKISDVVPSKSEIVGDVIYTTPSYAEYGLAEPTKAEQVAIEQFKGLTGATLPHREARIQIIESTKYLARERTIDQLVKEAQKQLKTKDPSALPIVVGTVLSPHDPFGFGTISTAITGGDVAQFQEGAMRKTIAGAIGVTGERKEFFSYTVGYVAESPATALATTIGGFYVVGTAAKVLGGALVAESAKAATIAAKFGALGTKTQIAISSGVGVGIGAMEGLKIKGQVEMGIPKQEILRSTMWDVTNIIGGGTSFQYGIKHGMLEYDVLKGQSILGEPKIVARAIGIQYKGGAKILVGKAEAGWTFGKAPTITQQYYITEIPKTATGAKLLQKNIQSMIGKETPWLVEGKTVSPQLQQKLIGKGYDVEVALRKEGGFIFREQLYRGTERLSPEATRSLLGVVEKYKGTEFGSGAIRVHIKEFRTPHDIDVYFGRMSTRQAEAITAESLKAITKTGEIARVSPAHPYSIETLRGGQWLKATEFKIVGMPSPEAPVPAKAMGFELGIEKQIQRVDGLKVASLIGEGERKFIASIMIKEPGMIGVGHAQRFKDVGDWLNIGMARVEAGLLKGTITAGQAQKAQATLGKLAKGLGIDVTSVGIPVLTSPPVSVAPSRISYGVFAPISISPSQLSKDISKSVDYMPVSNLPISSPITISPITISSQISKSVKPSVSPSPYISPISPSSIYPSPSPSLTPSPTPSPSMYPSPSPSPSPYIYPSVSPSPSPSPSPYYVESPYVPPPMFALAPMLAEPGRGKRKKIKQPLGYQPSLTALFFGIIGEEPRGFGRGRLTGFEIRPITKASLKLPKYRLF